MRPPIPLLFENGAVEYVSPELKVHVGHGKKDQICSWARLQGNRHERFILPDDREARMLGWQEEALWLRKLHGVREADPSPGRAPIDLDRMAAIASLAEGSPLAEPVLAMVDEVRRLQRGAHEALAAIQEVEPAHDDDNLHRTRALEALQEALRGAPADTPSLLLLLRGLLIVAEARTSAFDNYEAAQAAEGKTTELERLRQLLAQAEELVLATAADLAGRAPTGLAREQLGRALHAARKRVWQRREGGVESRTWEELPAWARELDGAVATELAAYFLGRAAPEAPSATSTTP